MIPPQYIPFLFLIILLLIDTILTYLLNLSVTGLFNMKRTDPKVSYLFQYSSASPRLSSKRFGPETFTHFTLCILMTCSSVPLSDFTRNRPDGIAVSCLSCWSISASEDCSVHIYQILSNEILPVKAFKVENIPFDFNFLNAG